MPGLATVRPQTGYITERCQSTDVTVRLYIGGMGDTGREAGADAPLFDPADLASRIPAALDAAIKTLPPNKANLPIVKTLRQEITSRAHHCKKSTTQATRLIESSSANDGP